MPERQDLPDTKNGFRGGGVHTDFIQTIIDIWDITAFTIHSVQDRSFG